MKAPNRGQGNRSLLAGGKGDKDRTTDNKSFSENFDGIDFHRQILYKNGFEQTDNKQRKVYGPRAEKVVGPHIRIS